MDDIVAWELWLYQLQKDAEDERLEEDNKPRRYKSFSRTYWVNGRNRRAVPSRLASF